MAEYKLTWITENLAIGYAPMSYADLDSIKAEGINGIVNLCAEFCDLHEIQEESGFEVYYLPIQDESAPDMEDMEKALAWLDEAVPGGSPLAGGRRFRYVGGGHDPLCKGTDLRGRRFCARAPREVTVQEAHQTSSPYKTLRLVP